MGRKDADHIEIADALITLVVTVVVARIVPIIDRLVKFVPVKIKQLRMMACLHITRVCASIQYERTTLDYTLTIRPADANEWRVVMELLTAMQVSNVIIDEQANVIMISENPVRLARIISVIAGTLYEE